MFFHCLVKNQVFGYINKFMLKVSILFIRNPDLLTFKNDLLKKNDFLSYWNSVILWLRIVAVKLTEFVPYSDCLVRVKPDK